MAVEIPERERLKRAIEMEDSFGEIERVLDLQRRTDHVEIGGEAYLAGRPETLLLRDIQHEVDYFSDFLAELRQGEYLEAHFRQMRNFLQKDIKLTRVDRRRSKNLLRRMQTFQGNGQLPEEAKEIGEEYKHILSRTYYKPEARIPKKKGLYIGDFHVHDNGERPSEADRECATKRPELVIISDRYRSAGLVYLYANGNGEKVRRHKFGPYNLFSHFVI